MAKPVLRSYANGFCTASKDDDGTGDKRRLVLLAKHSSHPILLGLELRKMSRAAKELAVHALLHQTWLRLGVT
jgi:hypothetical protein